MRVRKGREECGKCHDLVEDEHEYERRKVDQKRLTSMEAQGRTLAIAWEKKNGDRGKRCNVDGRVNDIVGESCKVVCGETLAFHEFPLR